LEDKLLKRLEAAERRQNEKLDKILNILERQFGPDTNVDKLL
jgi:hypothetical protein